MATIHTLLFADQDASLWGACWLAAESGSAPLACRAEGASGLIAARVDDTDPAAPWRLGGEEVSLVFEPSGPAARGGSTQTEIGTLEQLCTVSGHVLLGGTHREVDCLGWRTRAEGSFELSEIGTFRQTYGWFDLTDGVSLLALRPRRSRAHDADLVAAAVLEPEPGPRIADPRLSSTYDAAGAPIRVGLELWFDSEGPADEDEDADGDHQLPRRAAGEAIGDGVEWQAGDFGLQAVPVRWHSRGRDGTGLYLLGKRG